jgi:hypothetical protein
MLQFETLAFILYLISTLANYHIIKLLHCLCVRLIHIPNNTIALIEAPRYIGGKFNNWKHLYLQLLICLLVQSFTL